MDNWRKYEGESHYAADHQGRRPYFRKPPLDNRQSSVPLWEKRFCASLGSVSWRKLLETKKYMFLHDNVVHWDDSAGREAFHNAKTRFWAELNGLPCNISMPDPNIYIDHIDWDSGVDPELLLELETEPKAPTEGVKNEKDLILGDSLQLNQSFSCTGWGEAAELQLSNVNCNAQVNHWEVNSAQNNDARNTYVWGDRRDRWHPPEQHCTAARRMEDGTSGSWGMWDWFEKKSERPGWYIPPHYRTSNLPSDDCQKQRGWRNGRGRKGSDFAHDQPYTRTTSAAR